MLGIDLDITVDSLKEAIPFSILISLVILLVSPFYMTALGYMAGVICLCIYVCMCVCVCVCVCVCARLSVCLCARARISEGERVVGSFRRCALTGRDIMLADDSCSPSMLQEF